MGINNAIASDGFLPEMDTTATSTQQQAISFINQIVTLSTSIYWPNVKSRLFLENIKLNIYKPLNLYGGVSTDFCGYAALSYLLLHDNPLAYAKFMMQLYEHGIATMGKISFHPSPEIKQAAGALKFKEMLDIRAGDQMWFLCLADYFKGYLNVFDHHYNAGDEDKLWAWVNNLNYYVDEKMNSLVFISMRPAGLSKSFTNKKYYIITYFPQP